MRHVSWVQGTIAALVYFVLATSSYGQVPPVLTQKAPDAAQIVAAADSEGFAPVIVEFASPGSVQGLAPNSPQISALKAQIASARDAIVSAHFGSVSNPRPGIGFNRSLRNFDLRPMFAVNVNRAEVEALAADPRVVRIHLNRLLRPSLNESVPLIGMTGASGAYALGATGANQAVAIVDTGVQANHEFLTGKVVMEACFSNGGGGANEVSLCPDGTTTQTGSGAANAETAQCISGSTELCVHGTHVAGIAAGKNTSQNGSEPPNGVAKDAKIVAVQVFTRFNSPTFCSPSLVCVLAYTSDIIAGLDWIFQNALTPSTGVSLASVNMSLGGDPVSGTCDLDPTKPSIDTLLGAGVATAIAAGNDGETNKVGSPGCISTAVTVSSTTETDKISYFSNMSSVVDLLAPGGGAFPPGGGTEGTNILSSIPVVPSSTTTYANFQGTSMATPHVAGAFAAIRTACPTKTIAQILSALQTTGIPVTDTRAGGTLTMPRIRVDLAVTALACVPFPSAPVATAATSVTNSGFTANWNSSVGATGYRIDVSTSNTFASFVSGYQDLDVGNVITLGVTGLSANTAYFYRVRAYSSNGTSGSSNVISVTTTPNPPSAPTANSATNVTVSSFTANWSSQSGATGYRIDVSTSNVFASFVGGYQDLDVGNVLSQNVTGLSATTTYYYRLRAYNTGGTSGNSNVISVTTSTPPPSCTLGASSSTITQGQSTTLSWSSQNATSGSIDNGVGAASPVASGSQSVSPIQTTTYIGTFSGAGGGTTCQTKVTVNLIIDLPPTREMYVSKSGLDANDCSLSAPCLTIQRAIAAGVAGAGPFAVVLNSHGVFQESIVLNQPGHSVTIRTSPGVFAMVAPTDTSKPAIAVNLGTSDVVQLLNMVIDGSSGAIPTAVDFVSGAGLEIDRGSFRGFGSNGVLFEPGNSAGLLIANSVIANSNGSCVLIKPSGSAWANGAIRSSQLRQCATLGVGSDATATTGLIRTLSSGSIVFSVGSAAVSALGTGSGTPRVIVERTDVMNSNVGVLANGSKAQIVLNTATLIGNGTAASSVSSGGIFSFGNSAISFNTSNGVAPSLLPLQ